MPADPQDATIHVTYTRRELEAIARKFEPAADETDRRVKDRTALALTTLEAERSRS